MYNHWTPAEDRFIRNNFCQLTDREIAEKLGKDKDKVKAYRRRNNILKGKGMFYKGHTPWNKGRKGCKKGSNTSYKKGNEPANTLYDGAIRIRHDHGAGPYKWIRISKGNWKMLHKHLYEKHYGPVPKGMIVIFKDGDTLNCHLSNLKVISRAENMRRNVNLEKRNESIRKNWEREKLRYAYGLPPLTGNGRRLHKPVKNVKSINTEVNRYL